MAPPPPGTAAPLAVFEPGVVEGLLTAAGLEPGAAGEALRATFDEVHASYRQPDGSYRQENVFQVRDRPQAWLTIGNPLAPSAILAR